MKLLRAVLPIAALTGVSLPASALMLQVPFEQRVATADAIVVARVTGMQCSWSQSPRLIVTDVQLQAAEVWAGTLTAGQPFTVRVLGGRIGDIGLEVEHQPNFVTGETVVLLLKAAPSGRFQVHVAEQGKLGVIEGGAVLLDGRPAPLAQVRASVARLRPKVGR